MGKSLSVLALACLAAAVVTARPSAQSSFMFQTSFDCPEWRQSDGLLDNQVCATNDQISGWGGWTSANGAEDLITSAANNPLGSGRGFRHWRGGANTTDNPEGKNNGGGGVRINLPSQPKEIWLRYYSRWQAGFKWQWINYTKELYINASKTSGPTFTTAFSGDDDFGLGMVYPSQFAHAGSPGWRSTMGGTLGDGKWHYYEFHMNSVTGVMESWVDGILTKRQTGMPLGGGTIDYILIGSNQCCVAIQPDMYTDYDDVAISTSGYIGPIGGGSAPPQSGTAPSAPANLRISS